jgi:hypothetical protein
VKKASTKPVRCAIYTRVSTEHGLEQDFNSLDAQYDAAQAYIRSQAHAGWTLIMPAKCLLFGRDPEKPVGIELQPVRYEPTPGGGTRFFQRGPVPGRGGVASRLNADPRRLVPGVFRPASP